MADLDHRRDAAGSVLLIALVMVVASCALLLDAACMGAQMSRDALGAARLVIPLLPLFVLAVALAEEPGAPFVGLKRIVTTRGPRAAGAILCFFAAMASFSTFKTNIPDIAPFWADDLFTAADEAIFSVAPWTILHRIIPSWLGEIILRSYSTPWFVYWFGTYFAVAWTAPSALRVRYLLSFALTLFLLGAITATVMASAGPIFMPRLGGSASFDGLHSALMAVPYGHTVIGYADYLYELYQNDQPGLGSGISAFPSIHCASVFLNAIYFSHRGRIAGALAWAFAALIYVGSIYTGWHYALDGVGSLIGVVLIWRLSGMLVARAERTLPRIAALAASWRPGEEKLPAAAPR